ncbi:PRD domain-containing protein, partial [Bacillus spizizenii]
KIQTYTEQEYEHKLTSDELLYLTIHIERVDKQT